MASFILWLYNRAAQWAHSPLPFIHPISANDFLSHGETHRSKCIQQDYTYRARVCLVPSETYLICLLPWKHESHKEWLWSCL